MEASCPRCALGDYTRTKRADGVCHKATEPMPTMGQLEHWSFDGVAEATDGCQVEPDGRCPHGHLSWLRQLGIV